MGLLALVLGVVDLARAHPIHTSVAEIDCNYQSGKIEVAMRVFADDLEAVLSARAKKKITLEKSSTEEIAAFAQGYFAQHFTLRSRDGAFLPLEWVGHEVKAGADEVWLYFQAPLGDGIEGARIHDQVLMELFPDQINSIRVRDMLRRTTLVFLRDQGEKTVQFPNPPPKL